MLWHILEVGLIVLFSADLVYLYYSNTRNKKVQRKPTIRRKAIPKKIRRYLLDQSGSQCSHCGNVCCSPHIDHKLPVALGGTDDIDNLQVLCASCNLHKGAKREVQSTPLTV
jgi:5-methylcytosine-specific restriction endonuclease McrA